MTASTSLSHNTPGCLFSAKKRSSTSEEITDNAKFPPSKHRRSIEQQLKSAIISKIALLFPDDIASLMIQSATAEIQTLSDTELIHLIKNDAALSEWAYDDRHTNKILHLIPTPEEVFADDNDNHLPRV